MSNAFWFIAAFVVLTFFAGRWTLYRLKRRRARTWPAVSGRVDATEVRLEQRGGNQSVFVGEVRYSYMVHDAAHRGVLRRSFIIHGRAHKWMTTFAEGQRISVKYNPENPRDSLLEAELA